MAKKDVTRLAVEHAADVVERVIQTIEGLIPYGPDKVLYTPEELRRQIRKMSGPPLLELMDQLGDPEMVLEAKRAKT